MINEENSILCFISVQVIIIAEDQQTGSTENLWENRPFLLDLFFALFHYFLLLDTCHVNLTQPGIKPLALEAHSLNHRITREIHPWSPEWAKITGKWFKKGYNPGTNRVACLLQFLGGSVVKNPPANAGDGSPILKQEDPPGIGNSNPLQNSYLEDSMDRWACWVTVHEVMKSWTQVSDWTCMHAFFKGQEAPMPFLKYLFFFFFSSKLPFILYWLPNSPLWVPFPDWLPSPLYPDMLDCSFVLVLCASQLLSRLYFLFMLSHLAVEGEQGLLVSLHED